MRDGQINGSAGADSGAPSDYRLSAGQDVSPVLGGYVTGVAARLNLGQPTQAG